MKNSLNENSFEKGGRLFNGISSPANNGDDKQVVSFVEDNGTLKYTTSVGEKSLASTEYVNGVVGNINTLLDEINGEVI